MGKKNTLENHKSLSKNRNTGRHRVGLERWDQAASQLKYKWPRHSEDAIGVLPREPQTRLLIERIEAARD